MAGGTAPQPQTVTVGSSAAALNYIAVANSGTGPAWLSVTPGAGNTTANPTLTINADPSKLSGGTYNGTVTVTSPGAGNSPAVINVSFKVDAGTISAPTTPLVFTQITGAAAPAAQTIAVTSTPSGVAFSVSTSSGATWLTATPASGAAPGNVQVSVNAGNLAVNSYTGTVTIASGSQTIQVPVTLNVVAQQTLSADKTSLTFTYTLGQSNPASQSVVVSSSGTNTPLNVQASTTTGSWLQVTPTSGNAPLTLAVSVTPGTLTAGNYDGKITITSPNSSTPVVVPVTLAVSAVPKPVISKVGNAGSYATGALSPGENIVIFGTGLGPATLTLGAVTNGVLATTAGSTRVLFDGVPAPVYYASDAQTSVFVPYGVSGRTTTSVVVEYSGVQSTPITYNIAQTAPGIYSLNAQGTGPGAIINQDGVTVNGATTPAAKGSIVSVYMTGEGQTSPGGVDGTIIPAVVSALKSPLGKVTATVGGVDAQVLYAGSAPGLLSGVMQVNVMIPSTAQSGAQAIVVSVGGVASQNGVTVAVQ
jgi:uncharacterized protein (TIGR03437 family)